MVQLKSGGIGLIVYDLSGVCVMFEVFLKLERSVASHLFAVQTRLIVNAENPWQVGIISM